MEERGGGKAVRKEGRCGKEKSGKEGEYGSEAMLGVGQKG